MTITTLSCAAAHPPGAPPGPSDESFERAGISPDASSPVSTAGLAYVMRTLTKSPDGCSAGKPGCAWVRFHWPDFQAASDPASAAAIDGWTSEGLRRPLQPGQSPGSLDETADRFLAAWAASHQRAPESSHQWHLERSATVELDTSRVVSVRLLEEEDTGGPHAERSLALASFAAPSGRRLGVNDLVAPGDAPALTAVAEATFRRVRSLPPGASLSQAGFRFPGGNFTLTENFLVGPRGLSFAWRSGEIAPPAMGPTEILVEWEELRPLARAGTLLGDESPPAR